MGTTHEFSFIEYHTSTSKIAKPGLIHACCALDKEEWMWKTSSLYIFVVLKWTPGVVGWGPAVQAGRAAISLSAVQHATPYVVSASVSMIAWLNI